MVGWFLPGLALAAFLAVGAQAAETCPDADPEELYDCLKRHEVANAGDLEFDLRLARQATLNGDHAYAAVILQRVVARHPGHAGARLDLVLASMSAGDLLTASRHLNVLASIPNPPPVVSDLLKRLSARLKPADKVFDAEVRFRGSIGAGFDTNPNLGVFADAIDLVINGSPLTLIPDDSFRPAEDIFLGASFSTEFLYSPRGLLRANAYIRQYEELEGQNNYALAAQLYQGISDSRYVEVVLADFRTGDDLYLSRAGFKGWQKFAPCRCIDLGIGVDYLQGSEKSSQAVRYSLGLESATTLGLASFKVNSDLAYSDQPHAPWGNTLALNTGVDAAVLVDGWRASVGVSAYLARDDDIYSPLFPGEKRDLARGTVRLGAAYRLTPTWELFFDWTYSRQYSDIALFEYKRQVSAIGVNFAF